MPFVTQSKTDQYSNDTYADLLTVKLIERMHATVIVRNQHGSHGLKYKILASNDPQGAANTWAEEKAEDTISGGSDPVRHVLTGPFVWVKIQIKSNGPSESPQASAWLMAIGV